MNNPCTQQEVINSLREHTISHGEGISAINVKMDEQKNSTKEVKKLINRVCGKVDTLKSDITEIKTTIESMKRSNTFIGGVLSAGVLIGGSGAIIATKFGKGLLVILTAILK